MNFYHLKIKEVKYVWLWLHRVDIVSSTLPLVDKTVKEIRHQTLLVGCNLCVKDHLVTASCTLLLKGIHTVVPVAHLYVHSSIHLLQIIGFATVSHTTLAIIQMGLCVSRAGITIAPTYTSSGVAALKWQVEVLWLDLHVIWNLIMFH